MIPTFPSWYIMLYEKHTWFSVDNYYYCIIIIISSSSSSMPMIYSTIKPELRAGLMQNTHLHHLIESLLHTFLFCNMDNNLIVFKLTWHLICFSSLSDQGTRRRRIAINNQQNLQRAVERVALNPNDHKLTGT